MSETPNLKLPFIAAAQAQKHVTHNEALVILDAAVQARVIEIGLTTPPGGSDGDAYIPGSGATGAWSGWDWNLVFMLDGSWRKVVPEDGWVVYNDDDGRWYAYDAVDFWTVHQTRLLEGSKTHDWASISAGASASTTVTVTGAALGDFVEGVAMSVNPGGMILAGQVTAADTVTVTAFNPTGGAIDIASGTLKVRVRSG